MKNEYQYPTEKELKRLKKWNLLKEVVMGIDEDLLDYIESLWWAGEWGFKLKKGRKIWKLELHTGGWSGNEDIIYALKGNYLFWGMYWQKSTRGGHYYFEIKRRKGDKK